MSDKDSMKEIQKNNNITDDESVAIKVISKRNIVLRIIIPLLCVIVILMLGAILVFPSIFSKNETAVKTENVKSLTAYSKDNSLYVFDSVLRQSYMVDNNFTGDIYNVSVTPEMNWIYYTNPEKDSLNTYSFYRKSVKSVKSSKNSAATQNAEKINENIISYDVSSNGNKAYYLKAAGKQSVLKNQYYDLYVKEESNNKKLDSNVIEMTYSAAEDILIYSKRKDEKTELKYIMEDSEPINIADGFINKGAYVHNGGNVVYYISSENKTDVLYKYDINEKVSEKLYDFGTKLNENSLYLCYVSGDDVYYSKNNVLYKYNVSDKSTVKVSDSKINKSSQGIYLDENDVTRSIFVSAENNIDSDNSVNDSMDVYDYVTILGLPYFYADNGKKNVFVYITSNTDSEKTDDTRYSYCIIKNGKTYRLDNTSEFYDCIYFNPYEDSVYMNQTGTEQSSFVKAIFNDNGTFSFKTTHIQNITYIDFGSDDTVAYTISDNTLKMCSDCNDFMVADNGAEISKDVIDEKVVGKNCVIYKTANNELYGCFDGKSSKIEDNITDFN